MTELLFKDEVYRIIGAAIDVHRELGPGFLEAVYQDAMQFELDMRRIPYESQSPVTVYYKGRKLKKEYYADLLCFGAIIVELKAIERLTERDHAQLLNYLKATGMKVGVLINFGAHGELEWKRFVKYY
ncbi:MAG: GxxExxY protein [bacterium]